MNGQPDLQPRCAPRGSGALRIEACQAAGSDAAANADAIDWAAAELPRAWPDAAPWWRPAMLRQVLPRFLGRRRGKVRLPAGLPGLQPIPKYLLQEFHNLPNGNYSDCVTGGYMTGFDRVMLGHMAHGRRRVAESLRDAARALDVGSGGGHLAAAMRQAGIAEVWALEPSPYLLRQAARRHAGADIHWRQGLAEDTRLPDGHFDAVGVSFVLHEIPPRYLRRFCAELRRITRPGARLAVLEPSPLQWRHGAGWMLRRFGWRGLYFRWLAGFVHEPFLAAWHKLDFPALLREHGFEPVIDESGCPSRFLLARRGD